MLLTEAQPVPGLEELAVAGRHEHVVVAAALVQPALGRDGIEIPHDLRLLHGVAGELDPDVRTAPVCVVVGSADEIADEPATLERGRPAGGFLPPNGLDLRPRCGRVFETRGQQRLRRPVPPMAPREEVTGRLEVLVGERAQLQPGHAAEQ